MYVTLEIFFCTSVCCIQYLISWNFKMSSSLFFTAQLFSRSSYKLYISPRFLEKAVSPELLHSMNNNALWSLNWVLRRSAAHRWVSLSSPRCCLCSWLLCWNPFWSQRGSWHRWPGPSAWKPSKKGLCHSTCPSNSSGHNLLIILLQTWRGVSIVFHHGRFSSIDFSSLLD